MLATDLPSTERNVVSECAPFRARMHRPEWKWLMRLLVNRRHLALSAGAGDGLTARVDPSHEQCCCLDMTGTDANLKYGGLAPNLKLVSFQDGDSQH